MPLGMNRTDLNTTHTNYRNGTPINLATHSFGTPVNLSTKDFGNPVTLPVAPGNAVTEPKDFGNQIQAGN